MKKITKQQVSNWIPIREQNTYKNKMGHVLCIGGNENMGGAIILSASAALNAGSGLVTVATAPINVHALHTRNPEAMFINMYDSESLKNAMEKANVIILGPGLGLTEKSSEVFKLVISHLDKNQWLIIDGDAISHYVNNKDFLNIPTKKIVLTPHLGEWRRLTHIEPPADNIKENLYQAEKLESVIILKKERSEVYIENELWENTAGNPSMATGGMGDTLTGIVASFLGQFPDKKAAILSAVYIHSAAADVLAKSHYVTLPTKIIDYLPKFIKNLSKKNETL